MSAYGGDVTRKPLPVTLGLLETEQGLEVVLEGEVESLGGEVSDDVGGVSSPQRSDTLLLVDTGETVTNTLVWGRKTTLLDPDMSVRVGTASAKDSHLILVLDQELDTLDRSGSGLGNSGRHTSHEEVGHEGLGILGLFNVGHGRYCRVSNLRFTRFCSRVFPCVIKVKLPHVADAVGGCTSHTPY